MHASATAKVARSTSGTPNGNILPVRRVTSFARRHALPPTLPQGGQYMIFAALLASFAQVPAAQPGEPQQSGVYSKWQFGRSNGYHEKRLSDARWRVDAQGGPASPNAPLEIVLYRSA